MDEPTFMIQKLASVRSPNWRWGLSSEPDKKQLFRAGWRLRCGLFPRCRRFSFGMILDVASRSLWGFSERPEEGYTADHCPARSSQSGRNRNW